MALFCDPCAPFAVSLTPILTAFANSFGFAWSNVLGSHSFDHVTKSSKVHIFHLGQLENCMIKRPYSNQSAGNTYVLHASIFHRKRRIAFSSLEHFVAQGAELHLKLGSNLTERTSNQFLTWCGLLLPRLFPCNPLDARSDFAIGNMFLLASAQSRRLSCRFSHVSARQILCLHRPVHFAGSSSEEVIGKRLIHLEQLINKFYFMQETFHLVLGTGFLGSLTCFATSSAASASMLFTWSLLINGRKLPALENPMYVYTFKNSEDDVFTC